MEHTVGEAMIAMREKTAVVTTLRANAALTRDDLNKILRAALEEHESWLGTWVVWEPNALDGRDAAFANTPGSNDTGRFLPYWNRGTGQITVDPITDYNEGDYYQIPLKTGKEKVVDPYQGIVGDEKVLMTSVSVPIIIGGAVVGVMGADLAITTPQETDTWATCRRARRTT